MGDADRLILDSGLAAEIGFAFNEREGVRNYYRGNPEQQTMALEIYESSVVPVLRENEELRLDALLGDSGIINARAMERYIEGEVGSWVQNHRKKQDLPKGWVVMVADLDALKEINDEDENGVRRGHNVGNAALIMLGKSMAETCRVDDIVGRVGGDEFMVLMPVFDVESVANMMEGDRGIVERLRERVGEGRERLKREYGEKWPKDTERRKPGEVSLGWNFLPFDEVIARYRSFHNTRANEQKTNLSGLMYVEADQQLYSDKNRQRILD